MYFSTINNKTLPSFYSPSYLLKTCSLWVKERWGRVRALPGPVAGQPSCYLTLARAAQEDSILSIDHTEPEAPGHRMSQWSLQLKRVH